MSFTNIFKRLLQPSSGVDISPDPFAREEKSSPVASPVPAPKVPPVPAAVIHREEIIDGRSRIAGYRYRALLLGRGARPGGEQVLELLRKESVASLAQRRLALIPLASEDWRHHDFRQFIAPGTAFLVDPPLPGVSLQEWLTVLDDIRAGGARVAVAGAALAMPAALERAALAVVRFSEYCLEDFERVVHGLKNSYPALQLVVEDVHSWAEHRLCLSWGAHCSLGQFATEPDEEGEGEKLGHSRLVLIEMLNLLRQDADASLLAEVAKRDPAVALKVVAMANSPMSGLGNSVTSVDQAIVVLGREYLYRWLTISMFRVGGSPRDEALLELALRRARFLEMLALDRLQKAEADELFLVGLLSLADILLGLPIDKLIERINLSAQVASVLKNSEGPYGRYLMLAIAVEKGQRERITKLAQQLGLDPALIEAASAAAQSWTEATLAVS